MPQIVTLTASIPRSLATVAAALLLASACSSSNPAGTPGAAGSGGPDGGRPGMDGSAGNRWPDAGPPTALWSLTPAATPATVTFTLETSTRVAKDVPLTGGTITAVAKDGTKFELTVPDDALFEAQTIVMTPALITEQPFSDEPAWGVQLLPDGLVFNKPVTLVITPEGAIPPVNQQVPFGWSGADNTVFLANPDPKDAHLALKLLHFSSYAYATARQGMSASLAGVRNRLGGSAEARIQSAAAELLGYERQAQLLGVGEPGFLNGPEYDELRAQWDKEVVQPRIAAAGSSCAAGRLAIQTVLGDARQQNLLGFGEELVGLPLGLMETVENVCLDEEWALCRDHHIIQRMIPLILGIERQHQLLGIEAFASKTVEKALMYLYKCHQFELEVFSTTGSTCDQWTFTEPVKGVIKLKLDDGSGGPPTDFGSLLGANIKGVGPLTSLSYTIGYVDKCSKTLNIQQIDPRFVVSALAWSVKSDPLTSGNGEIKDFTLGGAPGLPQDGNFLVWGSTHQIQGICSDPIEPPETVSLFNWYAIYTVVMGEIPEYFNEFAPDVDTAWHFDKWMVYNDGGPVLAKKVVDEKSNDGDINYTAATTLLLTHKPAP